MCFPSDLLPEMSFEMTSQWPQRVLLPASICSLVLSLAYILLVIIRSPSDAQCIQDMYPYSPAKNAIKYSWVSFADYFYPASVYRTSPFSGTPFEETEKAWTELSISGLVEIPMNELDLQRLSSLQPDWELLHGRSSETAAAVISVFGQLKCLNFVRQFINSNERDYSNSAAFRNLSVQELKDQVGQCLEVLRLHFVCTGDVTPYLLRNNPKVPRGNGPDFGSLHRCRNFESIKDWAEAHSLYLGGGTSNTVSYIS